MRRALLVVATASFVGFFAFINLATWYQRGSVGVLTAIRPDGLYVRGVVAGSPADDAGFETGDRIVARDGLRLADGLDMRVVVANTPPYKATVWQLERNGVPLTRTDEARLW